MALVLTLKSIFFAHTHTGDEAVYVLAGEKKLRFHVRKVVASDSVI